MRLVGFHLSFFIGGICIGEFIIQWAEMMSRESYDKWNVSRGYATRDFGVSAIAE